MAAKDTNEDRKRDGQDNDGVLDMSQTAVKKMSADARERGYITYDQLNAVLPPDQVSSDQIEDVMSMLSEMGIQVTEEEESEEAEDEKIHAQLEAKRQEEEAAAAALAAQMEAIKAANLAAAAAAAQEQEEETAQDTDMTNTVTDEAPEYEDDAVSEAPKYEEE